MDLSIKPCKEKSIKIKRLLLVINKAPVLLRNNGLHFFFSYSYKYQNRSFRGMAIKRFKLNKKTNLKFKVSDTYVWLITICGFLKSTLLHQSI